MTFTVDLAVEVEANSKALNMNNERLELYLITDTYVVTLI